MDGRVKPGHDGKKAVTETTAEPLVDVATVTGRS